MVCSVFCILLQSKSLCHFVAKREENFGNSQIPHKRMKTSSLCPNNTLAPATKTLLSDQFSSPLLWRDQFSISIYHHSCQLRYSSILIAHYQIILPSLPFYPCLSSKFPSDAFLNPSSLVLSIVNLNISTNFISSTKKGVSKQMKITNM